MSVRGSSRGTSHGTGPGSIHAKIDQSLVKAWRHSTDSVFADEASIRAFTLELEVKNIVHQDDAVFEATDIGHLGDAAAPVAMTFDLNDQIDRAGDLTADCLRWQTKGAHLHHVLDPRHRVTR